MAWVLVTPSSRGIGLALTKHLLKHTPPTVPIVATTRASDPASTKDAILADLKPAGQLDDYDKNVARLDVQTCDLLSESSIRSLSQYCQDRYNKAPTDKHNPTHLRLGLMIPGMLQPEKSPQQIEYDSALATLKLNLLAPMMLLKHFVPLLPRKAVVMRRDMQQLSPVDGLPTSALLGCMSARVGSITDNALGGWYSYRASKAGLNQVVKATDLYVKVGSGGYASVIGLHPGTVKTDLSREFWATVKKEKLFEADFAAAKLVDVVNRAGDKVDAHRGRCWDWKGEEVPP